ncbi:hypothetical protein D3C80_1489830 [compost metagenome]
MIGLINKPAELGNILKGNGTPYSDRADHDRCSMNANVQAAAGMQAFNLGHLIRVLPVTV